MRTDANLGDTGSVGISGTIQRGSTLTDTPLDLRVVLEGAQLGQLTTLIYGRDRGWRGSVRVSATLRGTPAALKIAGDATVDDFRRYDIATSGSLRLAAHCTRSIQHQHAAIHQARLQAPVGGGAVVVLGSVDGILPLRGYDLVGQRQGPARRQPAGPLPAHEERPARRLAGQRLGERRV